MTRAPGYLYRQIHELLAQVAEYEEPGSVCEMRLLCESRVPELRKQEAPVVTGGPGLVDDTVKTLDS